MYVQDVFPLGKFGTHTENGQMRIKKGQANRKEQEQNEKKNRLHKNSDQKSDVQINERSLTSSSAIFCLFHR